MSCREFFARLINNKHMKRFVLYLDYVGNSVAIYSRFYQQFA